VHNCRYRQWALTGGPPTTEQKNIDIPPFYKSERKNKRKRKSKKSQKVQKPKKKSKKVQKKNPKEKKMRENRSSQIKTLLQI